MSGLHGLLVFVRLTMRSVFVDRLKWSILEVSWAEGYVRMMRRNFPIIDVDPFAEFSPGLTDYVDRYELTTLQVNLGKKCNQACGHCHVDAGPRRTEMMTNDSMVRLIELMDDCETIGTIDVTGGAPEMNPHFRELVQTARRRDKTVIDRCNLTILSEDGYEDLAEFLACQGVKIVASLPCYTSDNVDKQRGRGVFDASITGLQMLNALGYGREGSGLEIDLVYNPGGAFLPPPQEALEKDYKLRLMDDFGIEFNHLLTITNLPVNRFADGLARRGALEEYETLLRDHFNPDTVPALMCRTLISVSWDGHFYDCDFNQMLEMPLSKDEHPMTLWSIDSLDEVVGKQIRTGRHCFGCTAGSGSSCGGALSAA